MPPWLSMTLRQSTLPCYCFGDLRCLVCLDSPRRCLCCFAYVVFYLNSYHLQLNPWTTIAVFTSITESSFLARLGPVPALQKTYHLKTTITAGFSLGVPRNNQIFFRYELKQTETQSVLVVFRFVSRNQQTFFRFISVCFGLFRCFEPVSKQTELCQNKPKQTEKISKKHSLLGGPRNS